MKVAFVDSPGFTTFTLTASGAGLSNGVYTATLLQRTINSVPQYIAVPITFTVGASADLAVNGVSSLFSGNPGLAPGMLANVTGTNLAPATQHAPSLPLPLPYSMQGVSVTVNGMPAPLLDVSSGQLTIQIPYSTGAGMAVIGVNNNGKVASFSANVAAAAPDLLPKLFDPAGAVTSQASRGSLLTAFITGDGDIASTLADGATPGSNTPPTTSRLPISVSVGGLLATLRFVGIPVGLAGVTQINFMVPDSAPLGIQPVVVRVGGTDSSPVNLTVTR